MQNINITIQLNANEYRVYNPYRNEYSTIDSINYYKLSHKYDMLKGKGYEANDDSLIRYYIEFKKWNDELFKNGVDAFTYKYNNQLAVFETFYKLSNKTLYDIKKDSNIIMETECKYFEGCNNGGLQYCLNGRYQCYGYDFNAFYPRMLGDKDYDMQIPIKEGAQIKVNNLLDLKYGFYNVLIECEDENFNKIFKYSKKYIYTHYALQFAKTHQAEFNISITLNFSVVLLA